MVRCTRRLAALGVVALTVTASAWSPPHIGAPSHQLPQCWAACPDWYPNCPVCPVVPPPVEVPWDGSRREPVLTDMMHAPRVPFFSDVPLEVLDALGIMVCNAPEQFWVWGEICVATDGHRECNTGWLCPFASDVEATGESKDGSVDRPIYGWRCEQDAQGSSWCRVEDSDSMAATGASSGHLDAPVTHICRYCWIHCECDAPDSCWCVIECDPPGCFGGWRSDEVGDWVQERE
jgi:hypothetical protein